MTMVLLITFFCVCGDFPIHSFECSILSNFFFLFFGFLFSEFLLLHLTLFLECLFFAFLFLQCLSLHLYRVLRCRRSLGSSGHFGLLDVLLTFLDWTKRTKTSEGPTNQKEVTKGRPTLNPTRRMGTTNLCFHFLLRFFCLQPLLYKKTRQKQKRRDLDFKFTLLLIDQTGPLHAAHVCLCESLLTFAQPSVQSVLGHTQRQDTIRQGNIQTHKSIHDTQDKIRQDAKYTT